MVLQCCSGTAVETEDEQQKVLHRYRSENEVYYVLVDEDADNLLVHGALVVAREEVDVDVALGVVEEEADELAVDVALVVEEEALELVVVDGLVVAVYKLVEEGDVIV